MKQKIIVDIGSGSIKAYIVDENKKINPIFKKQLCLKLIFLKKMEYQMEIKLN